MAATAADLMYAQVATHAGNIFLLCHHDGSAKSVLRAVWNAWNIKAKRVAPKLAGWVAAIVKINIVL